MPRIRKTSTAQGLTYTSSDFDDMGRRRISEQEAAELWNKNAAVWARHVGKGYDVYRLYLNNPNLLKLIGEVRGKKMLDAGCGEGYNTRILARQGALMTGIDISKEMIGYARAAEEGESLGIRFEITSYTDLSMFPSGSFDAVVSFMALMDGPDFKGAMKAIFRVLRPGGNLYFSISHPCFQTKGMGWLKDARGRTLKLLQSDYFSKSHFVERWGFGAAKGVEDEPPFSIAYFPRTLSEYVNQVIGAGFVLKKLQEPRPSSRLCREHPEFKNWRNPGTIFLQVHARKPKRVRGRTS